MRLLNPCMDATCFANTPCVLCLMARVTSLEEEVIHLQEYDDEEHDSHLKKVDRSYEMDKASLSFKREGALYGIQKS